MELVKSAQLHIRDYQTGDEGFTLAGILLLARDDVILSVLPHHRTDVILRIKDLDRYDDRDDIRTNLIDSYDRMMTFIQKYLPDPFHLEGDQRISIRDVIFREAIANMLIHREYTNPYPAKLIVEQNRVLCENSNRPNQHGHISPDSFSPFPKNPVIARFFKNIGRADELGSGVRKLFRYGKTYGDHDPELIEDDIFRMIIPVPGPKVTPQATQQVTPQDDYEKRILEFCKTPRKRQEIQDHIMLKDREYFRTKLLKPLIEKGLLELTIPDKATSPNQKYHTAGPDPSE